MNTEDVKKLVNYYFQLTTFALNMQTETKELQSDEWNNIVSQVLKVSQDMNQYVTKQVMEKVCP